MPVAVTPARFILIVALAALAGCGGRSSTDVPVRAAPQPPPQTATSIARLPVSASLADLQRLAEATVPQTLWTIDRDEPKCVPAQRVTLCIKKDGKCVLGLDKAKVTPDIACHVSGEVTRGPLRLAGVGQDLLLTIPVSARLNARDTGGVLKGETATGSAEIRARIRLAMGPDWQPRATLSLDHDWREAPGVDLLGLRVTFTGQADRKLADLFAKLEQDLPAKLATLGVRGKIAQGWRSAFTVLDINHENPPVWLRVTPKALAFQGYRIAAGRVTLDLAAEATTETFIGRQPPPPAPAPLPPPARLDTAPGVRIAMGVTADWPVLEAVLARALAKVTARGIDVPRLGKVHPRFGAPVLYATAGNRVALGLPITLKTSLADATGTVWLTARAVNAPNSPVVRFEDLAVTGAKDADTGLSVLVALVQAPEMQAVLADALTQDFSRDLTKLEGKIARALSNKRLGDLVLDVHLAGLGHGHVLPLGQGLFLPAASQGAATLVWRPEKMSR